MTEESITKLLEPYVKLMVDKQASDMYFVTGAAANMKLNGITSPVSKSTFKPGNVKKLAYSLLTKEQIEEFETEQELNLSFTMAKIGRFRANIFKQRTEVSMVIRYIKGVILSEWRLLFVLQNVAKRAYLIDRSYNVQKKIFMIVFVPVLGEFKLQDMGDVRLIN